MAYPSLPITHNSRIRFEDGRITVRATNGSAKVRQMFTGIKRTFSIEHELSSAQKSTLDTFYSTDKDTDVSFTWPSGGSYTVRFAGPPNYTDMPGGWYTARVELIEV